MGKPKDTRASVYKTVAKDIDAVIDKNIQKVIDAIKKTAAALDCEGWEVGKRDILAHSGISHHTIGLTPGINSIKATYFPKPIEELGERARASEVKRYTKALEGKQAKAEYFIETLSDLVTKNIKPLPQIKRPNLIKTKGKKEADERALVVMLNDTHYGLKVVSDEVAGVNNYGWTEACRRTAYVIKQACQYKVDHRSATKTLHLIINGDILAGIIHGTLSRDLDLLTNQMNGAIHILVHAVAATLNHFQNVKVHFTFGNHGDMVHRREGGRVTSQAYDNYESIVFYALSAAFRTNPRVTFHTSKTTYGSIDLPAGRVIFAHGHILFSKELGNPGTQIKVKQLSDTIMRFNTGEVAQGRKRGMLFLFGHTHVDFSMVTPDGVLVQNISSLSGIDPYASALTINHNLTQQLIFESTARHLFGDSRKVNVVEADKDSTLDKIIPIYDYELIWKGSKDVA